MNVVATAVVTTVAVNYTYSYGYGLLVKYVYDTVKEKTYNCVMYIVKYPFTDNT